MDTYDEPMDVDTSQFLAPSTPLPEKQPNGNQNDISMNGSPRSAQKSAKAVKNGPKIVKAIRPNGSPPNSIGKSAGRRPPPQGLDQQLNGLNNEVDAEFNRDHYNNGGSLDGTFEVPSSLNPFQTKKALARTPSPTSSSTRHFEDFPVRGTEPAEKLVLSDSEGHHHEASGKNQAEKPCENDQTDQLGYFNNSRNGTANGVEASDSTNVLNDEWETHKKRATTAQNVNISIPPYEYQGGDGNGWHNQSEQPSPPNKPVSNGSCSSNVSSTTDISSGTSSVSPNPMIANEHDVDSATSACHNQHQPSDQQMNAMQERASSQSQLTSSSAASLSSATSVNNEPLPPTSASHGQSSTTEEQQSTTTTANNCTTTTTAQHINSINDDLTNVTNTHSSTNMDTLTPENEPAEMVKSQEIGGGGQEEEEFVPCNDLDPFKTPPPKQDETAAQNKRLNFVNSRGCTTNTTTSSFETAQSTLLDFAETSTNSATLDETQQSQFGGNQQAGESVLFDSIFSNDTDFQSFLDLLEKKEGDTGNKTSPKFSEFARKSLYLQFDPIIQSRSLSPEKIRRLSVIRDKQEAIKSFLSAEESTKTPVQAAKVQPKTLVEIEEEPESETAVDQTVTKTQADEKKSEKAATATGKKSANEFVVEQIKSEKLFNVKTEEKQQTPPMPMDSSLVSSTTSFNNELEREGMFDAKSTNNEDSGSDLGGVQQPFMKRSGIQRSTENVNSLASDGPAESKATNGHGNHHDEEGANAELATSNGHHDDDDGVKVSKSAISNGGGDDKSKDDDMKTLLISNGKQAAAPRPNLSSSKKTTNGAPAAATVAAASTNKLAFAGAGISNADEKGRVLEELRERERAHLERISLLEDENEKFKTVAIEFERIFHNLIKDKEESESKLKAEIIELTKERDHLQEDVVGVERAFDDLHRRFEKLKTKVEEFKKNEETLQNALETYKQQLEKEKLKYSTLKKHAEDKIDTANSEIEKLRKGTSIEIQTLKAELRKAEIKISSLELSVQQKDQENTQLTNLLEDLLSKVKPNA